MGALVRRLGAWATAFAAALFASSAADIGAAAWAQAASDNLWTRSALSGDWGGLRSALDRNGVTFTFNYTNDFLANVRGGIGRGAVGLGVFQPALDLDLGKLAGWDGGHFHTHGLITHGPLFSPTYLGNILTVSNLEAGPVARLYSFWYEQNAFNDLLSVRAGLMSADSQFLQSKPPRISSTTASAGRRFLPPIFLAAGRPIRFPLPASAFGSSRAMTWRFKPPYSVATRAGATAAIRTFRFPPAPCSAFAAALLSSRS
jgi:carbohydrate-selective porin OprB